MRDKLVRSIAFAIMAAISVGIAPSFASDSDKAVIDNANLLADGQCQARRIFKRPCVRRARPAKPKVIEKIVRVETERIIEKPVIIEKEVCVPAPVCEEQEICIPAVVETCTPVIIDRYSRRHRSLIHLGLFPFSLFGGD